MVFVSTMHKAKGREYDDVFVYLNRVAVNDDNAKRLLYVAFSRAKSHLTILSNSTDLQALCVDAHQHVYHGTEQTQATELALYLTHKDVNLGRFTFCRDAVRSVQAGDILSATQYGCFDGKRREIAVFSRKFRDELTQYHAKGYKISHAEVNFVVLWRNKDTGEECRIVLPIVYLS